MVEVILISKDKKEITIKVPFRSTALKKAKEYVQKNLNRKDRWYAYYCYDGRFFERIGNASERTLYRATSSDSEVISYETIEDADGRYTFYTKEEALAKRESYRAEAEELLDEIEKKVKETGADLVVIERSFYDCLSDEGWVGIEIEIEGYYFVRPIYDNQ